ncbi:MULTISPECIES: hypothetical protein [Corallococcus]|uniref:hypothetical protein n=1 Tax=Corallococcus TaxID=83461 RepID=UPI001F29D4D2|nr:MULTISPECIES: hypothetical protein [Corallococcus]
MTILETWNLAWSILLSIGSAGGIILGLSNWLGKVWANRILEREKLAIQRELQALQAESAQRLHTLKERTDVLLKNIEAEHSRRHRVHNLQFAKEFQLYADTWKALHALKIKTLTLRPVGDVVDVRETEEERRERRYKEFAEAFNAAVSVIAENEPFFPREVFVKIHELQNLSRREAFSYYYKGRQKKGFDMKYWEEAEENQQRIIEQVDAICEAIRTRIGLIEIVEGPQGDAPTAPSL